VSLENVIIKEAESTVVGTVKVKNLSFHKEVFIRASWDSWKSQVDTFCTFSQIVGASGAYVIYDTFSFKLTLPPHSRHLEFCVCYQADGKEYWDNNQGINYILTNRVSAHQQENELVMRLNDVNLQDKRNTDKQTTQPIGISKNQSKFGTWSEFSTRHNLDSPLPYW
jgi:protein phosphatase 1 regulatory subunit 3A/B/C/D/E